MPPIIERKNNWVPDHDEKITDVPLPEYDDGKFGFEDGSRPQFNQTTQAWQPYKEPVEPSPEMQAINQLGMLVAQKLASN